MVPGIGTFMLRLRVSMLISGSRKVGKYLYLFVEMWSWSIEKARERAIKIRKAGYFVIIVPSKTVRSKRLGYALYLRVIKTKKGYKVAMK